MRMKKFLPFLLLLPSVSFMTGCTTSFAPDTSEIENPAVVEGVGFSGTTYGGQSPIFGAQIYLLEATTSGYGAISKSLIANYTCPTGGATIAGCISSNTAGTDGFYYVPTNSAGYYTLQRAQYSCDVGQQVYLVSLSGRPGSTSNPINTAAGEMSVLGTCISTGSGLSLVPANSSVYTNEVSTVAAAYAFSGFWGADEFHLGSANTTLSKTGILNAANNAANLYNIANNSTATARTTTVGGNGTVPADLIDSIANSLANCVNATGPTSGGCATLLGDAKSGGTSGTTPSDTSQAAINIAHNPTANVTAIFNNAGSSPAFGSPILSSVPNDFTVAINYTDPSLVDPTGIAIDASGNAWVTDFNYPGVTKLSPTGTVAATLLDPSGEYGFASPNAIAIDSSGNAWIADQTGVLIETNSSAIPLSGSGFTDDVIGNGAFGLVIDKSTNIWVSTNSNLIDEFSSAGANETSDSGYTSAALSASYAMAVDASNNIFVTADATKGSAVKFSQTGTASLISGKGYGYTLSQKNPTAVALDPSNNVWIANTSGNSISKFTDAGASPSDMTGFSAPAGIAFDGAGNAWITNSSSNSIVELSDSGTVLSGSTGFTSAAGITTAAPTIPLNTPTGIAVDPSGNVWVTNNVSSTKIVTEFIGAATPVVTPIVANLLSPYSTPASKP
jgi:streptogramin lyase